MVTASIAASSRTPPAVSPVRHLAGCDPRHLRRIALQTLTGKHRLNPAALGPVQISLAGEQPVAQEPASPLHQPALGEFTGPFHQNGVYLVRVG
jgi:hypothetical protein